jgi:PAS domain S-box-containing protein
METSPVPKMEKAARASLPAGATDGESEESIKYEQQQELEALQQALEHSLRKFTTLYEFAPVGYMSLDRRGCIVKSNIALKVLLGTMPPQDQPTPLVHFITEKDRPRFSAFLQEAFSRHSGKITCELEISSNMPRINIVRLIAEATDSDEQCMVAAVDITELRLEEQRFHIMADNTYAWEFWLGPDEKFIYMSPSCKRVTGYEAAEFLDSPSLFYSIIHPDDRHSFDTHINQFRKGRVNFQYRIIHKNGSVRAIRHDGRIIAAADGTSLGLRGSNLDVTSGWRLKKKLLRSVEELNDLASKLNLSEERERRRIASLLHDQAVQSLAIGKLSLDSALHNGELPRHPVLRELEAILETTMRDLRLLSLDLSSPNLYDLGLKEAIAELGRSWQRNSSSVLLCIPTVQRERHSVKTCPSPYSSSAASFW